MITSIHAPIMIAIIPMMSPLEIINFLKNSNFLDYINEWEITLLPCINPYGYEFGTRTNHQGKDLNRLFKLKNPPEEVVFAQSILETDFKLIIDLHEDNESHGY